MVVMTMIGQRLECCLAGLTRHVFIDHVRNRTKQIVVIVVQLVFERPRNHHSKIPFERKQVAVRCGGKVCGCSDGLLARPDSEFIDAVIALARTLEIVERASFSGVDLEQDAGRVDRVVLSDQSRLA